MRASGGIRADVRTWTKEELVISCIAREFRGEVVAVGATVLSYLAARVAKVLYESDLALIGGSLLGFDCLVTPAVLNDEFVCAHTSPSRIDWVEQFDLIAADKFRIVLGPAQIDRHGSSNISVLGDWAKPKVQLVGSRGIPDDAARISELYFHVARHSPRTFVESVDFVCGLGYGSERGRLGISTGLPRKVVSDLGVFGFDAERGHMVIESLHPGVTFELCQERTGFAWPDWARSTEHTAEPTRDELECIREVVDPHGVRLLGTSDDSPGLFARLIAAENELIEQVRGPLA